MNTLYPADAVGTFGRTEFAYWDTPPEPTRRAR